MLDLEAGRGGGQPDNKTSQKTAALWEKMQPSSERKSQAQPCLAPSLPHTPQKGAP